MCAEKRLSALGGSKHYLAREVLFPVEVQYARSTTAAVLWIAAADTAVLEEGADVSSTPLYH